MRHLQNPHAIRHRQIHVITHPRLEQRPSHGRHPTDLARQRVGLVNTQNGDGALSASIVRIGHAAAEKDLVFAKVNRRVGDKRDFKALR